MMIGSCYQMGGTAGGGGDLGPKRLWLTMSKD